MHKRVFLLLLIPAILLIGGYLYLRFSLQSSVNKVQKQAGIELHAMDSLGGRKTAVADLRPLFIKRLQLLLKTSSANLYNLSIKDLQVDLFNASVTLQGVKLEPDGKALDSLKKIKQNPADVFTVSFDSLRIEGINLTGAITTETMDYKLVKLVKPTIIVHHQKGVVKKDAEEKEGFAQRFLKQMKKLSVKQAVIENGTLALYNDAGKSPPLKLNGVSIVLKNILIDSAARNDKKHFLFSEEATVSFRGYNRPTPDGLYILKVDAVDIKEPRQTVVLKNFSFTSPFDRKAFSARQKNSKELYNLNLPSITVENLNWWALLNEEEIIADAVDISGGKLSVYLDRSLPPKIKTGGFPAQWMMTLPLKLSVAAVNVSNLDFSYAEYNPLSQQTGTIYMDKVKLRIANASNLRTDTRPVTANASVLFMHQVPLTANFVLYKKDYASGKFSAAINAPGFDGTIANSFAPAMALVKVESGTLQKIEATVKGDQQKATADVMVLYKDLKIQLLEKDKGKKGLDKKDLITFVANAFVLKKDNPKGNQPPRRETASFTRLPEAGFLMLVWKTLLTGLLKTVGAPQKMAKKTIASVQKKKE